MKANPFKALWAPLSLLHSSNISRLWALSSFSSQGLGRLLPFASDALLSPSHRCPLVTFVHLRVTAFPDHCLEYLSSHLPTPSTFVLRVPVTTCECPPETSGCSGAGPPFVVITTGPDVVYQPVPDLRVVMIECGKMQFDRHGTGRPSYYSKGPYGCRTAVTLIFTIMQLAPVMTPSTTPFFDVPERQLLDLPTENDEVKIPSEDFADVSLNAWSFPAALG